MKIMRECFNPATGSDSLIGEYLTEGFREGRDQGINGYLVHNVPEYADQYNYIVARYIPDKDELWFWGAWKDEKPALAAAKDIDGQVIYRNGYNNDHNIANDYPSEETDECLKEDTYNPTYFNKVRKQVKDIVAKLDIPKGLKVTVDEDRDFEYDGDNYTFIDVCFEAPKLKDKKGLDVFEEKYWTFIEKVTKDLQNTFPKLDIDNSGISDDSPNDKVRSSIVINFKTATDECLKEDTVKQGKKWVNKGEDGTHGKFNTKKEADAQRKAMFANGYKEGLEEAKKEDEEEFDETAEAQTVKDFIDTFKEYDKDLALEFKPIIIDDKEYNITGIITDDSEEGKITVEIQYIAPEAEEETTDEAEDIEAEENDEWEDEVEESLTEDKTVDYVDYKHSYCHELEPKMKQLNYMCNVLKVPTGDVIKKILGILKSAKNINKTEKEQWFYDTIKNKKWNNSKEIYQFIKNSINKAKEVEATVDDKGELKKESLNESLNDTLQEILKEQAEVLGYESLEDPEPYTFEKFKGMMADYVNDELEDEGIKFTISEDDVTQELYKVYIDYYNCESLTEDDDEWEDEDELTEYLVKGLQEHINDRPDPIEDNSEFKGQDNAVVDCPVSKLIAHSEDEKPLDCEMKKEPLPKNLTTK